jgi:hypothetical protein
MSMLAPTLGVASACSDECIKIMRGRVSSGNQQAQINDKIAQVDAGSSAATMSLLRDFLLSETAMIEERIGQAGVLTPEERGLSRRSPSLRDRPSPRRSAFSPRSAGRSCRKARGSSGSSACAPGSDHRDQGGRRRGGLNSPYS